MNAFFDEPRHVRALCEALFACKDRTFSDTYRCTEYVAEVLGHCGLPVDAVLARAPRLSAQYPLFHAGTHPLLEFLHSDATLRERLRVLDPEAPLQPGDLLVIRTRGESAHHLALYFDTHSVYHLGYGHGARVQRDHLQTLRVRAALRILNP